MKLQSRLADPAETELLMEWRMRVLREVFELPEDTDLQALFQANLQYYEKELPSGGHEALWIEEAETGQIIGCGGLCYQWEMPSPDNPEGSCAYLMNVYIAPEKRGEGAGSFLVGELVRTARKHGAGKIYLETTDKGRPVYQKAGFTEMKNYLHLQ